MRITNEEQHKLDDLRRLRARDVSADIPNEIREPKVNGQVLYKTESERTEV